MSKIKKVVAMLLALTMVLGMSMTTFAAIKGKDDKFGTADDRGSISIGGIDAEDGITVTAYQIIEAQYNNGGSFSGYNPLYTVNPPILIPTEPTVGEDGEKKIAELKVTEAQMTQIVDQLPENATSYPLTKAENGAYVSGDVLPVGSYLVVVSGAETKVYSPIVASIYYVNENGDNAIAGGTITDISEGQAWTKVSDTPQVEKWIQEEDDQTKGNTVNIGDTVDYEVDVTSIPYYGGSHPRLDVVDTFDKGLKFKGTENDIEVVIAGAASDVTTGDDDTTGATVADKKLELNKDYTVKFGTDENGKETVTINFVVDDKYTLNAYTGMTAIIRYSATVTDDAVLNEKANVNEVVLNYTKDSKVEGEDDTDDDEVYSYTFDIDGQVEGDGVKKITDHIITKVGEETITSSEYTDKKALPDAEFTLYKGVKGNDGKVSAGDMYTNNVFKGVVTSSGVQDNNMPIKGLEAGTYVLKETKAPEGYSLNTHEYVIVIKATHDEKGKLTSWTITIDGQATSTFTVTHTKTEEVEGETTVLDPREPEVGADVDITVIPNTRLTSLPSTGGIGTTIFTIGGCLIMIVAAGLFFASRRKSAK